MATPPTIRLRAGMLAPTVRKKDLRDQCFESSSFMIESPGLAA
jgi:hypothetical protein